MRPTDRVHPPARLARPPRAVRRAALALAAAGGALFAALATHGVEPEPYGSVSAIADTDWWLFGRTTDQQHFSPLDQIDEHNAGRLGLAWYSERLPGGGIAGVPLVADGVAYVNGLRNSIYAVDLRSGKLRWSYRWPISYTGYWFDSWSGIRNRGLALWKDAVLMGTADCYLLAVSRETGEKLWATPVCDAQAGETLNGPPKVGSGRVFIGMAGGDTGARGHVDAVDAETGEHLWRFDIVPDREDPDPAQQRAAATWAPGITPRGGAPYDGLAFDSASGLLYVGTGGPYPWSPSERGFGAGDHYDELYTDSIVALDAKTGTYVWHHQATPDNAWNFESAFPLVIADLEMNGKKRRALMHSGKNGLFYALDAQTGELLNEPRGIVPITWASGIDMETGRPVQIDAARYDRLDADAARPVTRGGHNAYPISYSPLTGLAYLNGLERDAEWELRDEPIGFGGRASLQASPGVGFLVAWDPRLQRERWRIEAGERTNGGPLATAGNVVVDVLGEDLLVVRADTGEALYRRKIPTYTGGSPSTILLDGVQLVLLPADDRLLAFKLGGEEALPPPAFEPRAFEPPPLPRFPESLAERGGWLFEKHNCKWCHAMPGEDHQTTLWAPDLRRSSAATHEAFQAIVLEGLLAARGMAHYGDPVGYPAVITPDHVRAIQAYVINEAWRALAPDAEARLE